jgi:hypothetical protein
MVPVERTLADPRIADMSDFPDDQRDDLLQDFLLDESGNPRTDARLAFAVNGSMCPARDLAVFEVAPSATERTDPRVYRADISAIRHPDAEFIAAAPQYVRALLDLVDTLHTKLQITEQRLRDALVAKHAPEIRTAVAIEFGVAQFTIERMLSDDTGTCEDLPEYERYYELLSQVVDAEMYPTARPRSDTLQVTPPSA